MLKIEAAATIAANRRIDHAAMCWCGDRQILARMIWSVANAYCYLCNEPGCVLDPVDCVEVWQEANSVYMDEERNPIELEDDQGNTHDNQPCDGAADVLVFGVGG